MERISWRWFAIIPFLVLSVCPGNAGGDEDWNLEEETKGWIDPHSMLEPKPFKKASAPEREVVTCDKIESDCSVAEKSLAECGDQVLKLKKDLEKQKELVKRSETTADREQPFFEQYLRHILGLFTEIRDGKNVGHYEASISLSGLNYGYLSSYVTNQNVSVQEVHSILLKLMTDVRWIREDDGFDDFSGASDKSFSAQLLYYLNIAGAVSVVLVALLQIVSLLRRVRISFSRFVFLFLFAMILTSFVISIPWTWWHLYKKKVAERMVNMERQRPDCANQMNSLWRTIMSHFAIQHDECQKYYEHLEIDPLWEVPPTQAVAVTFVRFFLEPAKHVGQAIREFMVSVFDGLPILLWLPVYAFIIFLIVLVLFCLGGYRISVPFMSIEPARPNGAHQMAALQDRIHQLQLENQELRQLPALPDARGNAVDGRGDRRRTPLQLEEPPVGVEDVERHDVEATERSVTSLTTTTLKIIPADSKRAEDPTTLQADKSTPTSAAITNSLTQDDVAQEESIAEFTAENPPTADHSEPNAEHQIVDEKQIDTNVEDLQQFYVMIETICAIEDADLDENSPRENKTGATDAVTQVTDLAKTPLF